jgi:hypothetical protein
MYRCNSFQDLQEFPSICAIVIAGISATGLFVPRAFAAPQSGDLLSKAQKNVEWAQKNLDACYATSGHTGANCSGPEKVLQQAKLEYEDLKTDTAAANQQNPPVTPPAAAGNPTQPKDEQTPDEKVVKYKDEKERDVTETYRKTSNSGGSSNSPGGNTGAGGSTAGTTPSGAGSGTGYIETKSSVERLATSDDKCAYSASYDGKWSCDSTENMGTAAMVSNQVTQMVGSAAVQMQGQKNASEAQSSGTQSGAFDAAAKSAKQAANIEAATGLLNVGMGAILVTLGMSHNKNAKKASAAAKAEVTVDQTGHVTGGSGSGVTASASKADTAAAKGGNATLQDMAKSFGIGGEKDSIGVLDAAMNDPRRAGAIKAKEAHVNRMLQGASREMAKEQNAAGKAAMTQGISSLVTGGGQLMMGMAHRSMADSLKGTSNKLKEFDGKFGTVAMPTLAPGDGTVQSPSFGGMSAPVISAAEQSPTPEQTSALNNEKDKNDDEKPLSMGLDQKGFAGLPTPGPQNFNAPGAPESGSGSGIAGAGIAGAGGGDGHGDQGPGGALPREADPRYASGNGGGYGRGGGGGAGGSGAPDLSGMVDKLMAGQKPQEEAQKPSLEEFGRDPASEVPYSFLDKSVNIFQRVHQAYQQKAKAGRVALF